MVRAIFAQEGYEIQWSEADAFCFTGSGFDIFDPKRIIAHVVSTPGLIVDYGTGTEPEIIEE